MSTPDNIPKPEITTSGYCVATTTGFNRKPGFYECTRVLTRISVEVDDDTGKAHNLVQPLECPMRVCVTENIDDAMSRIGSRMVGEEVTIHEAHVVGPEDDTRPGGCTYYQPPLHDLLRINLGGRRTTPRDYY